MRCSQAKFEVLLRVLARVGLIALACAVSISIMSRALAEESYGAQARVERPAPATHPGDPSAAGTALDLQDRVMVPRSLADVVREAPGARVTNTGGLGAFSSVSLRGADNEETQVLLNEIPLLTPDGGALDLSFFPAELFGSVEVYRGGAPVWLGSGAIGGVLRLIPRGAEATSARVSLGAGSFGTWDLQGSAEVAEHPRIKSLSSVIARGSRGDFPYVDDGGTRYDRADDGARRRTNAEHTEASVYQGLTWRLKKGTLHAFALGSGRTGGFPGPASHPTPKVHRQSQRAMLALSYDVHTGRAGSTGHRRFQLTGAAAHGRDRFSDIYGQVGTSRRRRTDDRTLSAFVRGAGTLGIVKGLEATLVTSYQLDVYAPHDAYQFPRPANSTRHTGAGALELAHRGKLGRARYELRPSARIAVSQAELHARSSFNGPLRAERHVVAPTYRLGGMVAPWSFLAFSASVATGTRLPSIFELFGDRGLTLPSFDLKPVRSDTVDGGITLCGHHGLLGATLELRGFVQERHDAIAMYRTSRHQVGHENIASVRQWGSESGTSLRFGEHAALHGSFTWLETATALDKRLPFRPRYIGYVRPEGQMRFSRSQVSRASVSAELWHRSFAFVDRGNLAYTDDCTKLALSAAVDMFQERVRLGARIDDVLDARCTDLIGYPLPGRSLFFSITYQETRDAT